MAGYSGTPLPQKLGIKPGARVFLAGEVPANFVSLLVPLPEGARLLRWPEDHASGAADVLVYFTRRAGQLTADLVGLSATITPAGGLWIAWPKKTSKVFTDLTEDGIRDVALPLGVVDNKVCAIDEVWSGLRLVWRKGNRPF